jgi:predicted RNase H-like HicB family nuclease
MKGYPQLSEDALKYRGEWVGFSSDYKRVVGHGETIQEAVDMAKAANEEHCIVLFIPERSEDLLVL